MKKVIVLVAILCFLGAGGYLRAEFARIGLDAKFVDWDSVTKVSDPNDDDLSDPNDPNDNHKVHDILEVAMANDGTNLYWYARVDDSNNDEFGNDSIDPNDPNDPNSPLEGSGKWEEIHFYFDMDNDVNTGWQIPIGPNGGAYTFGAEYRSRTTRRGNADPNVASGQTEIFKAEWNDFFQQWLWQSLFNTDQLGIPCPVRRLTGVNEMEGRIPYAGPHCKLVDGFFQQLLHAGDTITYTVLATRLSESDPNSWETDWLDTPQSYTIVSGCSDPCHPYPEGDLNRDCRVNYEDLKILTQDWVMCTEPNKPGCADLGWY